jgi:thymidine kinase
VRHGWLEVVCGPMFSGKSEELIRRVRRAEIAGLCVLIVKPAPFAGETVQIGALDSYEARCRACYEPGPDAQALAS